jgi:hypothetical protein
VGELEVFIMKNKVFTAVLMLVFMCAACLVVGPVLSGEHPWDSDKGDDDERFLGGDIFYKGDTVEPVVDTAIVTEVPGGTTPTTTLWYGMVAGALATASLSL